MRRFEWEGEMGMGKRWGSRGDQNRSKKGRGRGDVIGSKERQDWGKREQE
jgi:hypothetical protein